MVADRAAAPETVASVEHGRSMRRTARHSKTRTALLLGGLLLVGIGCGDGTSKSTPTTDVDLSTLNPPDVGAEAALAFLGVTGGAVSGDPVRIGFLNQGDGTGSSPEALDGARAAVAAINKDLGGVKGRPIELIECTTRAGESEVACAKRLRDAEVTLVITGRTPVDPAGMIAALDGVPVTGVDPRSIDEERSTTAAYYVIGRRGIANVAAQWALAQTGGPVLLITDPASGEQDLLEQALGDLVASGRLKARIELPIRDAHDGLEDSTRIREALRSSNATTVLLLTGPGGCVATAEATRDEPGRVTVVTAGTCSQRSVHDELGDWTPSWTHVAGGPNLEQYDTDRETAYYRHAFETNAGPDADWTGLANSVFSAFMNATRALNAARDLEALSVVAALRDDLGPGFASGRTLACRTGTLPARCLNEASLYEYTGGRHWRLAPGGERITVELD